jgi:hypothetical protein
MKPYEEAKSLIENELKKKNKADMFYELIMTLKKKYGVYIDEKALNSGDAFGKDAGQDAKI